MMPVIKICDNCGIEFEVVHKKRLENKHLFCCRKCESEYRIKNNPNWVPCVVCGKLTYKKPYEQRKNKQGFCCSSECVGVLRQELYRGKQNPNYGNKGSKNPIWKTDRRISPYGYILIRKEDHPFKNYDGFVFEHRLVAEQFLLTDENSIEIDGNHYLSPDYVVHHKDGNKQNNSVDNLEIMTLAEHTRYHRKKKKQLAS